MLNILRNFPAVTVLAMPTRRLRRSELEAQGLTVVENWADAISRGARYAVIATSTARHADDAGAALANGCDVLVEKPLSVDAPRASLVLSAATAAGRQVFVGCCLRFMKGMSVVRRRLPDLGRVHAVRIECQSYLPSWRPGTDYRASYAARLDEGGVLRDLIHEVDYALWLFGRPRAVQATLGNSGRLNIEAEETADLFWTADGASISLRLDYLTHHPRRKLTIDGECGTLTWDLLGGIVDIDVFGQAPLRMDVSEARDDKYREQLKAFLWPLSPVHDERLASARSGVDALAICDAARRSSITRCQESPVFSQPPI